VDLGFHPPLYHLKKIDINKNLWNINNSYCNG
jgi:hypothetical protein